MSHAHVQNGGFQKALRIPFSSVLFMDSLSNNISTQAVRCPDVASNNLHCAHRLSDHDYIILCSTWFIICYPERFTTTVANEPGSPGIDGLMSPPKAAKVTLLIKFWVRAECSLKGKNPCCQWARTRDLQVCSQETRPLCQTAARCQGTILRYKLQHKTHLPS